MLADTLSLPDAASVNKDFTTISRNGQETLRIDADSPREAPRRLLIRHSNAGKGAAAVDRHNLVFTKAITDDVSSLEKVASLSIVATVPRDADFDDEVTDLFAFAIEFISDADIRAAWLMGQS